MSTTIRQLMWVRHGTRTGIAYRVAPTAAECHFTDEKGETVGRDVVALAELSQATFAQIPLPRRPTAIMAKALGYA